MVGWIGPKPIFVLFGWFVAEALLGCEVSPKTKNTGGVRIDASAGGSVDASVRCPAGVIALLGDPTYASSQVALAALDGSVLSESFVSTASTRSQGLAFALSGDTGLPSTAPASGRVVVLDEYGTDVVTWLDPVTANVQAQLAVGTGFESNPQDYVELDATRALVSRWGEDGNPGDEPFDGGGDLLAIDIRTPKIQGRIPMPVHDGMPARPSGLTALESSVAVSLQRLSLDFSTYGDAEFVQVDRATLEIVDDVVLSSVSNCGRLTPRPEIGGFATVCTGPLDANGASPNLSKSALVLLSLDATGHLVESSRWQAADIANEPLQSNFDFADGQRALLKTQTPLGGSTNNRLLLVDMTARTVEKLAEAQPAADGTGQGITYGSVLCTPGCSSFCLLADGDQGVLRRFDFGEATHTESPAISVTPGIGLLPRGLSHFDEP